MIILLPQSAIIEYRTWATEKLAADNRKIVFYEKFNESFVSSDQVY